MSKNDEPQVPAIKDDTEIELESIEAQLAENFNEKFIKVLKRLVYEVAVVGLSEKEACVLVNFDYAQLISLKEKNELIRRLFDMKSLEYKRDMMKTLSDKARRGDEKLAQWLLEARYPDEFNRRKGGGGEGGGDDLLGAAVEFIQKSTMPNGVIKETNGRAMIVKKSSGGKEVPLNIHEGLVGRAKEIIKQIDDGK